jgi:hypothetical protein
MTDLSDRQHEEFVLPIEATQPMQAERSWPPPDFRHQREMIPAASGLKR